MITDELVRSIALFYFLSFLDEKVAVEASEKAITQLKARGKSDDRSVVRLLWQCFEQFSKQVARRPLRTEPDIAWAVPPHLDLTPWAKFQQEAGKNELIAVLLSRVLGFTDESIAAGLGISVGTARHRIGKGMRHLGAHLRNVRV